MDLHNQTDMDSETKHELLEKDGVGSDESSVCVETIIEDDDSKEEDGLESDGVPYDRGWAWMVAFGCFIHDGIFAGYMKCFSLFYVEMIQRFNAQASETALIFSIRGAVFSLSSLFIMNIVVRHLRERKTVLIGGLLMSLSAILPSMADELMVIITLQGVLHGLGHAMMNSPGEVLMGSYFRKRRSLAMALAKCGASLGCIVMPSLITLFLQLYGYSGALLLTGGLCLHSIPAAMLLRPTSYFRKRRAGTSSRGTLLKNHKEGSEKTYIEQDHHDNDQGCTHCRDNCYPVSAPSDSVTDQNVQHSRPTFVIDREPAVVTEKEQTKYFPIIKNPKESLPWFGLDIDFHGTEKEQTDHLSFSRSSKDYPPGFKFLVGSRITALQNGKTDLAQTTSLSSSCPQVAVSKKETATPQLRKLSVSVFELFVPEKTEVLSADGEWSKSVRLLEGVASSSMSCMARIVCNSASRFDQPFASSEDNLRQAGVRSDSTGDEREEPGKKRTTKCPTASAFMLDFSLFRRPLFLLLLAYFVFFPTVNILMSYLPALASENGITDSQNGLLLSIGGGLDLLCRITSAVIANSKIVRVPTMIIIAYVILGVMAQFVRFLTSFNHFLAYSILMGLLGGVANCMLPVLVLEFMGLDNMAKAMGFVLLICGSSSSAFFPLMGYIRDVTGSYVAVYHVIGAGSVLGAVFLCCEKWVRRLEKNVRT